MLSKNCRCALAASLSLAFTAMAHADEVILRVNGESTATSPDGLSWATAFKYLQDALTEADDWLANAPSGSTADIWVRGSSTGGDLTYYTDESTANPTGSTLRMASFKMRKNLRIYAGFFGDQPGDDIGFISRDPETNITILSGEINNTSLLTDNSYHVVTAPDVVDLTGILDGFTITGGYANGDHEVTALSDRGGGILIWLDQPGVGINSNPVIVRCRIDGNHAEETGGGAEIRGEEGDNAHFINCVFTNNTANNSGGGVNVFGPDQLDQPQPLFLNCLFTYNEAPVGGGAHGASNSSPNFHSCTFSQNVSGEDGGAGIWHERTFNPEPPITNGATFLRNSILWNNKRMVNGNPVSDEIAQIQGAATVSYSSIEDLNVYTSAGGGTNNIDGDPLFVNPASNFRLGDGSDVIDAGSVTFLQGDMYDVDQDFDTSEYTPSLDTMFPRIIECTVDMGAYEWLDPCDCYADITSDGTVGVADLIAAITAWGTLPRL